MEIPYLIFIMISLFDYRGKGIDSIGGERTISKRVLVDRRISENNK